MKKLQDLVISPVTRFNIERFIASDSHALLITGSKGVGRGSILDAIANELGASRSEDRIYLESDEPSISINQARTLRSLLNLHQVKGKTLVVIIENAEKLTTEAQNALLKQLEEPADNIYFLLSTHNKNSLLRTVVSRLVLVEINRVADEELTSFFEKQGFSNSDIIKVLNLSNRSVGLAQSILSGEAVAYIDSIDRAKQILSSNLCEKLLLIDTITKDKIGLAELLGSFERILEAGFHNAVQKKQNIDSWMKKLQAVEDSIQALSQNVSARILVLRLMLQL